MDRNNITESLIDELYRLFTITDNINNHVINNVTNQSLYIRNPNIKVARKEIIDSLVSITYKDLDKKEEKIICSITQEKFCDEDDIIQLPCFHCFLIEPIKKWLTEESNQCPVCRFTFDSEEKKENQIEEADNFLQENIQEQQQESNEEFIIIEDRSDVNNTRYRIFSGWTYH